MSAPVVVVGVGIAGAWLAYRLARNGTSVVLVQAPRHAETMPTSSRAAALLHRGLFDRDGCEFLSQLPDSSTTRHPELVEVLRRYLPREFAELRSFVPYSTFEFAFVPGSSSAPPKLGAGDGIVSTIIDRYLALGGKIVEGWVSDLVVNDTGACMGVRYTAGDVERSLRAEAVVLACGGYGGLVGDTATVGSGTLLGTFARHGGLLSNLEFGYRHAFGDLSGSRVLYPVDLVGANLLRDGEPAVWLQRAATDLPPLRRDLAVFRDYWVHNADVPHAIDKGGERAALGPIGGFSMGGIAHHGWQSSLKNLYVVGEAAHDLCADHLLGLPWATYLSVGGMLADVLAGHSGTPSSMPMPEDSPAMQQGETDLRREIRSRYRDLQFGAVSHDECSRLADWCRTVRRALSFTRREGRDLLILAEAVALSAQARCESRGFFFRRDFPAVDSRLDGRVTVALYYAGMDCVQVHFVAIEALPEFVKRHLDRIEAPPTAPR